MKVHDSVVYMPIKYHNAKDENGNIVNIVGAVRGKDYVCLGCGNTLRAKLGNGGREPHFFHMHNVECSHETYLHEYAKKYIKHLFDTREHFYVHYEVKVKCCRYDECGYRISAQQNEHDMDCCCSEVKSIDLKEYYTTCALEKEYDGFIPDILLSNDSKEGRKPVFIEIAITHFSTDEKIESGNKIIEVAIPRDYETDDLGDLSVLNESAIAKDKNNIQISFKNFERESLSKEPLEKHPLSVFFINESNRAKIKTLEKACAEYGNKKIIPQSKYEICLAKPYSEEIYDYGVARACLDGFELRECVVCYYYRKDTKDNFWPHKCGLKKMIHGRTQALQCDGFRYCEMKAKKLLTENNLSPNKTIQ